MAMNSSLTQRRLEQALWSIYNRPERPLAWTDGGNLPWDEANFAKRMLAEHLDESHSAASRRMPETPCRWTGCGSIFNSSLA